VITERRTHLPDILDRLPICIIVTNTETGLVHWANTRILRLTGATRPQQVVGHSLLEFIEPAQHGSALQDLEAVARGDSPPPIVYKLRRVDGGSADIQVSSVPVLFQGQPAMLSLCTDVTEGQRMLRALAESEERYRGLAENSPDGVVVVLADGVVAYVNPALARAIGLPDTDAMLHRSFYEFVVADDRKRVRAALKRMIETCEPHPASDIALLRTDGTTVHASARTTCVPWEGDTATQTIIHGLD
jgi:PAS domain S-box-containing protein